MNFTQYPNGWTNYTPCYTPEMLQLINKLYATGNEDAAKVSLRQNWQTMKINYEVPYCGGGVTEQRNSVCCFRMPSLRDRSICFAGPLLSLSFIMKYCCFPFKSCRLLHKSCIKGKSVRFSSFANMNVLHKYMQRR